MNGYLTGLRIAEMLERKGRELKGYRGGSEDFTEAEIQDMMAALTANMLKAARTDLNSLAVEILTADNYYLTTKKIGAIKQVRGQSGCGLKEAQDAVENALPGVLVEQTTKLINALKEANSRANWTGTRYLDLSDIGGAVNLNA